jgi:tetratricopeptide (TPR) repeat protein
MCVAQRNGLFFELALALREEGKIDSAIRVLDRCIEVFPKENVPYDLSVYNLIYLYFELGETEKAKAIAPYLIDYLMTNIDWLLRLKPSQREDYMPLLYDNLARLNGLLTMSQRYDTEFGNLYAEQFNRYWQQFQSLQKRQ